ncbi:PQQ-like beta-propeller repeat protein [Paracoccaceae bacterium]|nr:PQQ-like beta-propeller repeat protein [Paracoccaceae bacterium]
MKSIKINALAKVMTRLSFFLIFLVIQSCSNDERLQGFRQSVIIEETSYERREQLKELVLGKPKKITEWTHGGSNKSHNAGNINFSNNDFSSHLKVRIGPRGVYPEPIFKNNKVYILTPNGFIVVYDQTGKFLWELDILPEYAKGKTNIFGGLAINKDELAITSSLGEVLLVDVKKKKIIWRYDFKRPFRSSPIFHKQNIYAVTGDDLAVSIDRKGNLKWSKKGPKKNTKLFATVSPTASGSKVFFPFSGGSLMALSAKTGLQLWEVNLEKSNIGSATASLGDFSSDPIIYGNRIFAAGAFGETFASNTNGRVLWRNNIQVNGRLVISGDSVFYTSNAMALVRLSAKSGKVIFVKDYPNSSKINYSDPLLLQSRLLVLGSDRIAYWYSAKDGKLLKTEKIGVKISSAPIVINKQLIFVSENGVLNILS